MRIWVRGFFESRLTAYQADSLHPVLVDLVSGPFRGRAVYLYAPLVFPCTFRQILWAYCPTGGPVVPQVSWTYGPWDGCSDV